MKMWKSDSMIEFYADMLKRHIIDRKDLMKLIQEREGCDWDTARDIKYDVLVYMGEEM